MTDTATSLTSWARAIRKALDEAGCDSAALFARAGLDLAALEDPNARYPLDRTTALWRLAVAATGDEAFGLHVARHTHFTHFHALGYSLMASATLREVFERCARYFRIVTDAAQLAFEDAGPECHLYFDPRPGAPEPAVEAIDAFAANFVRGARALAGRGFAPLRVELRRPPPRVAAPFERLFRAPLRFAAPRNLLAFARADLERRLETANPELQLHQDEIILRHLARLERDNTVAQVRKALVELLPLGEPGEERMAEALHLSVRSLQRRLAAQGTSYKTLLNQTRRELALGYLSSPGCSVGEAAYLLGFADSSSFTRAFRRWTGVAPRDYRAQAAPEEPG